VRLLHVSHYTIKPKDQNDEEILVLRLRHIFGIYADLPRWLRTVLAVLPFVLIVAGYIAIAEKRHEENPNDKVTPTPRQLVEGFWRTATEPIVTENPFVVDTSPACGVWASAFCSPPSSASCLAASRRHAVL
jgi:hypothetical protein